MVRRTTLSCLSSGSRSLRVATANCVIVLGTKNVNWMSASLNTLNERQDCFDGTETDMVTAIVGDRRKSAIIKQRVAEFPTFQIILNQ